MGKGEGTEKDSHLLPPPVPSPPPPPPWGGTMVAGSCALPCLLPGLLALVPTMPQAQPPRERPPTRESLVTEVAGTRPRLTPRF